MPKLPKLRTVAATMEHPLSLAFLRSVEDLRKPIQITDLAGAIGAKDRARAQRLAGVTRVEEVLDAVKRGIETAIERGVRIGAQMVNEVLSEEGD